MMQTGVLTHYLAVPHPCYLPRFNSRRDFPVLTEEYACVQVLGSSFGKGGVQCRAATL